MSTIAQTKLTTQTNIASATSSYDTDLFKAGSFLKTDDANIMQYDPQIGGYGTFFWTKMPQFMVMGNPDLTERFKNITQNGHTSFDGINDLTAVTEDLTGGMAGNSMKVVTNVKDDFDEFTMKVYEMIHSPIREALEYWMSGFRDPKTGLARYHGLVDNLGYSAKNHTAELIYIVTDPSFSKKGIEYACMITNILPTKVPKSQYNITHGDHPVVSFDLTFSGVKYESAKINEIAAKIIEKKIKIDDYLSFEPKSLIDYGNSLN